MVKPRSTKFGMKTSYTCTQIKFISNFGCHAPFAHKVKTSNLQARDLSFGTNNT